MPRRRNTPEQVARNRALSAMRKEIAAAATAAGLTLTASVIRHTQTAHWQFRRDGAVVLHYWPTNGRWWDAAGNAKGTEPDPWKAFALACEAARQLEQAQKEYDEAEAVPLSEERLQEILDFAVGHKQTERKGML